MSELITIKTSDRNVELHVAKTYLEDNGIPVFIKDELMHQVHPAAVRGAKLQVRDEDVQRAIELLIQGGFATEEDYKIEESSIDRIIDNISSFFKRK